MPSDELIKRLDRRNGRRETLGPKRVEDGCIEEGSKIGQGSVSHFQVLSLCRELIEHLAALRIDVALVPQYILEPVLPNSRVEM